MNNNIYLQPLTLQPSANSQGPGQRATFNLPIGPKYTAFYLELIGAPQGGTVGPIGTTPADWADMIDSIRLEVNGRPTYEVPADFQVRRMQYYGETLQPGMLPIRFDMPWARNAANEYLGCYGTQGLQSFQLQVKFKDNVQIGSFKLYSRNLDFAPMGTHLAITRYSLGAQAAGPFEITAIRHGRDEAALLSALHMTTSDLDNIQVVSDRAIKWEASRLMRVQEAQNLKRTMQTDFTHIDFMHANRVDQAIPMNVDDFRIKTEVTAPVTIFDVYAETLETWA